LKHILARGISWRIEAYLQQKYFIHRQINPRLVIGIDQDRPKTAVESGARIEATSLT